MQSDPQIPTPPTPPAAPGVINQLSSIGQLQNAVNTLQARADALEAQRRVLSDQVRRGRPEVRAAVAPVLGQVDGQLAVVQEQLAGAQSELAIRQGQVGPARIIIPPPYRNTSRQFDPDLAAGLMFAFIFAVLMPISIAIARKIWRSGRQASPAQRSDEMLNARLDRLDQAVDAIAIEVERISEGQRFVTKVMTDRPPTATRASEAESASLTPDGKPILALGAGPVEPIPVAERQRVRQVVTPH